jgi:lysophospholipase L1-like esterase
MPSLLSTPQSYKGLIAPAAQSVSLHPRHTAGVKDEMRVAVAVLVTVAAIFGGLSVLRTRNAGILRLERCDSDARPPCHCQEQPDVPTARPNVLNWQSAHDKLCASVAGADAARIDVLWFGDSITEAWTGEDKGVKSAKNREFPAVWARIFEATNASRGDVPNLRFLPSAIGGDQTQHLLKRIQGCALANPALQPRVVVIAIGTNNIGAGCTSLGTITGITSVVHSVHRLRPDAKIVLCGLIPRSPRELFGVLSARRGNFYTKRVLQVNAAMKRLADRQAFRIIFVDPWPLFSLGGSPALPATYASAGALGPDGENAFRIRKGLLQEDWLHLSAEGYRLWGRQVFDAVHAALKL